MKFLRLIAAIVLSMSWILHSTFADDLVIIVNPDNKQALRLDDIARIYLGKQNRFPDGREAVPLDLDPEDPAYEKFAKKVLRKSPSQLRAYWAKRIFTGKGAPPKRLRNQRQVRDSVAEHPTHLGYLESDEVDKTVHPAITIESQK